MGAVSVHRRKEVIEVVKASCGTLVSTGSRRRDLSLFLFRSRHMHEETIRIPVRSSKVRKGDFGLRDWEESAQRKDGVSISGARGLLSAKLYMMFKCDRPALGVVLADRRICLPGRADITRRHCAQGFQARV